MYSSARIVHPSGINDNVTLEELNEKVFYRLHIPAFIFGSVCLFVGVVGNLFVLTIYKNPFRRSNYRYFIIFHGATDLFVSLAGIPFLLASIRLPYTMTSEAVCKVFRFILYALNNSSALLLVVIAVERYKKICTPYKKQFTHNQTLYLCIGTIVYSVLVSIPSAVFYGNNTIFVGIGNISGTQCYIADTYAENHYFQTYNAALMLETCICIMLFGVLYAFIIRKLLATDQRFTAKRAIKKSGRMGGKKVNEHSKDEQNSVEGSLDLDCRSTYDKERNHPTLNSLRKLHENKRTGQTSKNTSDFPSFTEQSDMSITQSQCNDVDVIELSSLTGENPKHEPPIDKSFRDNKNLQQNNSDTNKSCEDNIDGSDTMETSNPARRKLKTSLTPIQIQTSEQLLTKHTLKQRHKGNMREQKANVSKTATRVTIMLFTVTLVFVLAFVPHFTLMLVNIESKDFVNNMSVTQVMVYHVFLRTFIINSAANPVIYFIFDEKFRTMCKSVLGRYCRLKRWF